MNEWGEQVNARGLGESESFFFEIWIEKMGGEGKGASEYIPESLMSTGEPPGLVSDGEVEAEEAVDAGAMKVVIVREGVELEFDPEALWEPEDWRTGAWRDGLGEDLGTVAPGEPLAYEFVFEQEGFEHVGEALEGVPEGEP